MSRMVSRRTQILAISLLLLPGCVVAAGAWWIVSYAVPYGRYAALMGAIDRGDVMAARRELDHRASPDGLPFSQGFEDISPLNSAASQGRLEIVRLLLDGGA